MAYSSNAVATSRLALHTQPLDAQVTWARAGVMRFIDGLTHALAAAKGAEAHLAALRQVAAMVQQQALTLACNDVLLLMAGTFFVALPLPLLLARPNTGAMEAHQTTVGVTGNAGHRNDNGGRGR